MTNPHDPQRPAPTGHDYGPLDTYEVTWMSGHVERIRGHQITWRGHLNPISSDGQRRVLIHAELDGRWTLQLSALEDDIRTIRNVATEDTPTGPQ